VITKPSLSVCLFVCLFVCFCQTISQQPMQLGSLNLTYKCSTMSPGNPFILEVKRSRSQCLCRSSDSTQNCHFCCVRKLCWVFPAVNPRCTSNARDTGFSLCHFPSSAGRWVFPSMVFCTLASAGFFWYRSAFGPETDASENLFLSPGTFGLTNEHFVVLSGFSWQRFSV